MPPSTASEDLAKTMAPEKCCDNAFNGKRFTACVGFVFVNFDEQTVLLKRGDGLLAFPLVCNTDGAPSWVENMRKAGSKELRRIMPSSSFNMNVLYTTTEGMDETSESVTCALLECITSVPTTETSGCEAASYEWFPYLELESMLDAGWKWLRLRDEKGWRALLRFVINKVEPLAPWQKSGWYCRVEPKARRVLNEMKYEVTAPFQCLRIGFKLLLVEIQTVKGTVYLTMRPRINEGAVMRYLSRLAPRLVPCPLYVDEEEQWYLVEHLGEDLRDASVDEVNELQRGYAKLQIASMEHVGDLMDIGVPMISLEKYIEMTEELFENEEIVEAIQDVKHPGFEDGAQGGCRLVCIALKILYSQDIPMTITHGDLSATNILRSNNDRGKFWLIDWELARIDLAFHGVGGFDVGDVMGVGFAFDLKEYLKVWKDFGSLQDLRKLSDGLRMWKEALDEVFFLYNKKKENKFYYDFIPDVMDRLPCIFRGVVEYVKAVYMDGKLDIDVEESEEQNTLKE